MATKIVTKNSSTGGAVPSASDLVQGELAVNVADKRLFTEDNGGSIVELGTNPSAEIVANGGIALPDNGKVTFGASDDLQIYHDGTNSRILEAGAGFLAIGTNGTDIRLTGNNFSEYMAKFEQDGAATLYHNNSAKITTTTTGIDVTGTVTMDGLTVDGEITGPATNNLTIRSKYSATIDIDSDNNQTDRNFQVIHDGSKLLLKAEENGDISFYEDTGTTPKLFWDASAESLGIGTSSPQKLLEVSSNSSPTVRISNTRNDSNWDTDPVFGALEFYSSDVSGSGASVRASVKAEALSAFGNATALVFRNGDSNGVQQENLRIDYLGNVGIGTSSPSAKVHAVGDNSDGTNLATSASNAKVRFQNNSGSSLSAYQGYTGNSSWYTQIANSAGTSSYDLSLNPYGGNVGIGTSSPSAGIHLVNAGLANQLRISNTTTDATTKYGAVLGSHYSNSEEPIVGMLMTSTSSTTGGSVSIGGGISTANTVNDIKFYTAANNTTLTGSERMRIDSSGNLLVGKTASNSGTAGHELLDYGRAVHTVTASTVQILNRLGNDGTILLFEKDGTNVGSIGVDFGDRLYIGTGDTALFFNNASDAIQPFNTSGALRDNAIDLGSSSYRFDDIYATNGTIQTSDRNEKQDIAELSEAEQRVAVACKGLLRKFRWKDSVAEKGDDARIHFGIIAQDLQAAFEAEGLDAGDYAMFISTTWTDEETNEEKTRMGVRYSELLAFIISAI